MPSEPQIRKLILSVLNKQIIPLLQAQRIPQVLAQPPFDFDGVEHWTLQEALLADKKAHSLEIRQSWEKAQVTARRMSLLGFSYSGASLERVGVTRQMAKSLTEYGLPVPAGVTSFHLPAPGVLYVPAHVPHGGLSLAAEKYGPSRMLIVWFAEQDLWVCHHDAVEGGTHNLNIADPTFKQLEQTYVQMLEKRDFWAAQLFLLHFMKRLESYLVKRSSVIINSAWPSFDEKAILIAPHVSPRYAQHCYKAIDHIQFHIHTPLSLEVLAEVCGVTVPYLSHVFRKSMGITLMHYVTEHRIRAAEMMLVETNERISDIAKLVGFSGSHSFAGIFRRSRGMSPTQYRQQIVGQKQ